MTILYVLVILGFVVIVLTTTNSTMHRSTLYSMWHSIRSSSTFVYNIYYLYVLLCAVPHSKKESTID